MADWSFEVIDNYTKQSIARWEGDNEPPPINDGYPLDILDVRYRVVNIIRNVTTSDQSPFQEIQAFVNRENPVA
jgi:hypothetical protein